MITSLRFVYGLVSIVPTVSLTRAHFCPEVDVASKPKHNVVDEKLCRVFPWTDLKAVERDLSDDHVLIVYV